MSEVVEVKPIKKSNLKFIALFIVLIVVLAAIGAIFLARDEDMIKPPEPEEEFEFKLEWNSPYAFNREGYEPSIAVDSTGALYYTASFTIFCRSINHREE